MLHIGIIAFIHFTFLLNKHFSSCYFCGRKFILPQELSRHIRDKVCKTNANQNLAEVVDHQADSLNPMSLLDLPIITDISHENQVNELLESTQTEPSTSSAIETLPSQSYLMIDTKNEMKLDEIAHSMDNNTNNPHNDTPTLWGCKQCDFR